jgi:hypothetical protein
MDEGMMPKWYDVLASGPTVPKMSAGKRSSAGTTCPKAPAETYRTLRDFFTWAA